MSNKPAVTLSVSEISEKISGVIEGSMSLRSVRVRGEISNFTRSSGKYAKTYAKEYLYFSLKDDKAKLECRMFEGVSELDFDPQNGMSVVCGG